jgi:transcriptional regulator with PAS, ATPase and Fis domain
MIVSAAKNMTKTPASPISVLQAMQPTIVGFAKMLADVLRLEVEVVDANRVRVAGTGHYASAIGHSLHGDSCFLRDVLETRQEKIVLQSHADQLCAGCADLLVGDECDFIGVPIVAQHQCVGVIRLVALTPESQTRIREHSLEITEYVRHVSGLFVSKVIDGRDGGGDPDKHLLSLLDHMDQGVVLIDEDQRVCLINPPAQAQLNCSQEKIIGRKLSIRPCVDCKEIPAGHLQYVVSFGDQHKIIVGQLHQIHDRQLFLMAFHQAHPRMPDRLAHQDPRISHIVGESAPMLQLKALLTRVATSPSSILICSESGTGKEVVARAIHQLSGRANKPFVAINCAAIPDGLQESELFGYTKGSFTNASTTGKSGLIQSADHGTLFLDEIGDMSLSTQAKLLRVIETREVQPIGANKSIPIDIRIVAATHQNLQHRIAEGKFREDLYYRINVIPMTIPPLRDRGGDIELLVHHYLNQHARRLGAVYPGISPAVLKLLPQYSWPGNVRELSNLMEYLVNVVPDGEVIDERLLPPSIAKGLLSDDPVSSVQTMEVARPHSLGESTLIENMERQLIEASLLRHRNKQQAADELGIGIATLYRKVKKYGFR